VNGRRDGFRVARRTVTAIAARDLFRARRSIGARSSRAYLGVAGFRGGGIVDVLQGRKLVLDFFDLGTHGVAGVLEQCGRSGGAAAKWAVLRKATCLQIFFLAIGFQATGISTSRALDARRSTLDRVPPEALFLIACSRRVSVHYNIIERYSFHANFSASRSHLSTAAAGTSPLSPPCSTHVSLGLGGGASAPSPPPALGGSPKNLMA
jgi:hypothetical protein